MTLIWQRDPTICTTCEHPTRLHNTSGCVMPDCACKWKGRSLQLWGQLVAFACIIAVIVWVLTR